MSNFLDLVKGEISKALKETTQTVRGKIPPGVVDNKGTLLGVRVAHKVYIANPHGGQDAGQDQVTLKDLPMPRDPVGFIMPYIADFLHKSIGVIVTFRGGNMSFPAITSILGMEENLAAPAVSNSQTSKMAVGVVPASSSINPYNAEHHTNERADFVVPTFYTAQPITPPPYTDNTPISQGLINLPAPTTDPPPSQAGLAAGIARAKELAANASALANQFGNI